MLISERIINAGECILQQNYHGVQIKQCSSLGVLIDRIKAGSNIQKAIIVVQELEFCIKISSFNVTKLAVKILHGKYLLFGEYVKSPKWKHHINMQNLLASFWHLYSQCALCALFVLYIIHRYLRSWTKFATAWPLILQILKIITDFDEINIYFFN